MVEVDGLSGFWLAAGRLCYVISVAVPLLFAAVVVVLLLVAVWKGVVVVALAVCRRVLRRDNVESNIESCRGSECSRGGGHLWL